MNKNQKVSILLVAILAIVCSAAYRNETPLQSFQPSFQNRVMVMLPEQPTLRELAKMDEQEKNWEANLRPYPEDKEIFRVHIEQMWEEFASH